MNGSLIKRRQHQQYVSGSVLVFLASYLLSLCTLNPLVHAETLHHAVQTQQSATGHCARPSAVPQTSTPHATDHQGETEPLCCAMRGGNGKVILRSSLQIDVPPLLFLTLAPFDTGRLAVYAQPLPILPALPSFRPPPLYLSYAALLL
jgi:hypothetical protein